MAENSSSVSKVGGGGASNPSFKSSPSVGSGGGGSSYSRVGPIIGKSELGSGGSKKDNKKKFVRPSDYIGRRGGLIEQNVIDPNTGRPWVGTFTGWSNEGGPDDSDFGYWSFRETPNPNPFYDPSLPAGYKGARTTQQLPQARSSDLEALLALLSAGSGARSSKGSFGRPPFGGTSYLSNARQPGFSRFLGG